MSENSLHPTSRPKMVIILEKFLGFAGIQNCLKLGKMAPHYNVGKTVYCFTISRIKFSIELENVLPLRVRNPTKSDMHLFPTNTMFRSFSNVFQISRKNFFSSSEMILKKFCTGPDVAQWYFEKGLPG